MIGDMWVRVTLLDKPGYLSAGRSITVAEPQLYALAEEDDSPGGVRIPVDRAEWDAWRAAAVRYLLALESAAADLQSAERRARRAASRSQAGARRRAMVAAEAAYEEAAGRYPALARAASDAYWPIHCEIQRRVEARAGAERWLLVLERFDGAAQEQLWGLALVEHGHTACEVHVFRWDVPTELPGDAVCSERQLTAMELDRALMGLRAEWRVRRVHWAAEARAAVERETDGVPFELWWRAATARTDAQEKVIPPRSAAPRPGGPRRPPRSGRRQEILQLPEPDDGEPPL
ncbi:hypothetical protein GXW83_06485 [Streptacidiphilus sp. PB12-B1b]|uniref:hypothetical protein n=1 Tax=Streptacidiphilus sp. PB12-B1b TaxID=2705012 RepID=UPI0015F970C2|nr:hypothetical protein [Streptacidiphilus sp. PB12-B1b]QMU75444.1 hypothetical protein GXW83_06485 [Streptacidiphilus sp. PB12-B1b]